MSTTALGILLRHLREEGNLSLRELGDRANLDHAYIYRLEKGDKGAPSEEVVARLAKALELMDREREILEFVAGWPDTDPELARLATTDHSITSEEFSAAAAPAFRGRARPDPRTLIERARRILREEAEDG